MTNMWMVRAGEGAFLIEDFKENNLVAIGWRLGDLKNKSKKDIEELVNIEYSSKNKNQKSNISSQVEKFVFNFKKDDYVLSYNPGTRMYILGKITSDYYFTDIISKNLEDESYSDVRNVEWLGEIPRDKLKTTTKNTLGAILTVFNINDDAKNNILNVFNGKKDDDEDDEDVSILMDEIEDKSKEFIKDMVNSLDPYPMQDLVAALLRAMGYKTIVSPQGPDRGRDVIASPDGLGLEDPVIIVEVKHKPGTKIPSSDVRSLKGALKKSNKGIYVSTGGFTNDAKYEAERSEIPITLMDLDLLVKFILQYYDNFDIDGKSLIPLKKIYWPIK